MGWVIVGAAMASGSWSGNRLASLDALSLVWQASWIVQLVIALLVLLSVISWAIIAYKWRELRRASQDSEAFIEVYHESNLDAAYEAARDLDRSPLTSIFVAGYTELNRMARATGQRDLSRIGESHLHGLGRQISWVGSREGLRLERGLSFLATTGSSAPFIGLFGTVLGIINAFEQIGRAGSASLAVVAPGIAEALIATAIGLFAAIPATIFYNIFLGELRSITASIDIFSAEYEGDLRRLAGVADPAPRS